MGSFVGIASSLIEFCKKTELPIYIGIAEALEALGDVAELLEEDLPPLEDPPCVSVAAIAAAAARVATLLSLPSDEEMRTATHLVREHSVVEVLDKSNRTGDVEPELILLPEPLTISDFIMAPYKQEVSLMKQTRHVENKERNPLQEGMWRTPVRHVKQTSNLLKSMDPIRRTLLRASAGQCGRDSHHYPL